MPALSRVIIADFKEYMQKKYFKNHQTKIKVILLDTVYEYFERIKTANAKSKLEFHEFVDRFKKAGYRVY